MLETTEGRGMAKSARGGPRPGSGRPKAKDREDVAVKFDRGLAEKARLVASRRRITLAEYLTELTRAPIERDFAKAIREMGVQSE